MKRITLAAVTALCALAFALVGCSGGGTAPADAASLKGFWEIDPASPMGFEAALNLDDEDFAELVVGDAYLEGTWTVDGSNATIKFEDGGSVNLSLKDGKLIMGQEDGSKLIFVASDIDEYYSDQSSDASSEEVEVTADGEDGEEGDIELDGLDGMEVVDEKIENIDPVTIADDKICKIQVTGKGTDFTADPCYAISITNNTDKTIFVVPNDMFKVNGSEIEAGLGEVIEAGQTVESEIYFSADDLGGSIENLKKVEGTLFVGDDDTEDELATYTFKMD